MHNESKLMMPIEDFHLGGGGVKFLTIGYNNHSKNDGANPEQY